MFSIFFFLAVFLCLFFTYTTVLRFLIPIFSFTDIYMHTTRLLHRMYTPHTSLWLFRSFISTNQLIIRGYKTCQRAWVDLSCDKISLQHKEHINVCENRTLKVNGEDRGYVWSQDNNAKKTRGWTAWKRGEIILRKILEPKSEVRDGSEDQRRSVPEDKDNLRKISLKEAKFAGHVIRIDTVRTHEGLDCDGDESRTKREPGK